MIRWQQPTMDRVRIPSCPWMYGPVCSNYDWQQPTMDRVHPLLLSLGAWTLCNEL
jgi:hypothetical protein